MTRILLTIAFALAVSYQAHSKGPCDRTLGDSIDGDEVLWGKGLEYSFREAQEAMIWLNSVLQPYINGAEVKSDLSAINKELIRGQKKIQRVLLSQQIYLSELLYRISANNKESADDTEKSKNDYEFVKERNCQLLEDLSNWIVF